jgi:hypothetical protein
MTASNSRKLVGTRFDCENFAAMTGQNNFSSGEGIARRDGVIDALRMAIAAKGAEMERLKRMASWPITKPLRLFSNALSKVLRPNPLRR